MEIEATPSPRREQPEVVGWKIKEPCFWWLRFVQWEHKGNGEFDPIVLEHRD